MCGLGSREESQLYRRNVDSVNVGATPHGFQVVNRIDGIEQDRMTLDFQNK